MCLFYTKLDYAASGGELNPKKRIKRYCAIVMAIDGTLIVIATFTQIPVKRLSLPKLKATTPFGSPGHFLRLIMMPPSFVHSSFPNSMTST
jgi:hypothetical protein